MANPWDPIWVQQPDPKPVWEAKLDMGRKRFYSVSFYREVHPIRRWIFSLFFGVKWLKIEDKK